MQSSMAIFSSLGGVNFPLGGGSAVRRRLVGGGARCVSLCSSFTSDSHSYQTIPRRSLFARMSMSKNRPCVRCPHRSYASVFCRTSLRLFACMVVHGVCVCVGVSLSCWCHSLMRSPTLGHELCPWGSGCSAGGSLCKHCSNGAICRPWPTCTILRRS